MSELGIIFGLLCVSQAIALPLYPKDQYPKGRAWTLVFAGLAVTFGILGAVL